MSMSKNLVKAYAPSGSVIALSGVTTGTTTAGPILDLLGPLVPEWDCICANVSAAITTNSLVVKTKWRVSNDGSTFVDLYGSDGETNATQIAATGNGGLVTTNWAQMLWVNAPYPYVMLAVVSTGATGGAGDNITVTYNFIKRGALSPD